MFVQDKIADMLTRIRNANQMKYKTVDVIGTKMTKGYDNFFDSITVAQLVKRDSADFYVI